MGWEKVSQGEGEQGMLFVMASDSDSDSSHNMLCNWQLQQLINNIVLYDILI